MSKILLVDDDPDILELLEYNLKKEGYETSSAKNGLVAIDLAKNFLPDLILLDIMMPQLDGIETAKRLRKIPELKNTFIIFLTARIEEYAEVAAFEAGADDFILKPVKVGALISRLKAVLRRDLISQQDLEKKETLTAGNFIINLNNHTVLLEGEYLSFAKKEFELLYFLVQNQESVFSREKILHEIWGQETIVLERTVDVHIRKLREKIGEKYIKTLKGVGYMFSLQ
ncbi:MAG: response regulator transcription factor [Bacteroidota bacterium]